LETDSLSRYLLEHFNSHEIFVYNKSHHYVSTWHKRVATNMWTWWILYCRTSHWWNW